MKNKLKVLLLAVALIGISNVAICQQKYYDLQTIKQVKTAPAKDLQRPGSCWSNAGTALIEAEWIKNGRTEIDLSEMTFIRNAYELKAFAYLNSKGATRLDERLLASDVFPLMVEYGMAPEEMFMKTVDKPRDASSGEMDAILRGTMQMVMEKEGGNFTERWQSTFNAALSRYLGETRIAFNYNNTEYTPKSFAETSGINATDYIVLTSDSRNTPDSKIELPARNNWNKTQAYNVSADNLQSTIRNAVNSGYTVIWYGNLAEEMIFPEEMVAIVPAGKIADLTKPKEGVETTYEPLAEKAVSPADRQANFEASVGKELDYLMIFGTSKDKNGNEYVMAKKVCEAGNKTIHLSPSFVKLNTGYVLLNKKGLPGDLKSKLSL
ncbi:MAG: hypothetical protein IH598_02510 [Bacteroidales bacterium]|nr:hypothetical protein [Bacteroidales bacterium]